MIPCCNGKSSLTISAKPVGVRAVSQLWMCTGRAIFVAGAHRGNGKRFVARPDEKLTAFIELEATLRAAANCLD